MIKSSLGLALMVLASMQCRADILEKVYELTSSGQTQQEIKSKATSRAIEMVSTEMLESVMTGSKADVNKKSLISRMTKESPRYVVSIQERILPNGKVEVKLGVSKDSFKQILLQKGLYHEISGPIRVLPMISVVDRVSGANLAWWNETKKIATSGVQPLLDFHLGLKTAFMKGGFFVYDPLRQRLYKKIPAHLRSEKPSSNDLVVLSQYFQSSLVVSGQIGFFKSSKSADSFRVEIEMRAIEPLQDRIVAEVVRTYETEPGLFLSVIQKTLKENTEKVTDDLASQVIESWKRGSLGSQQMKLSLNGRVSHSQYESIKDLIIKQIAEIKGVRERLFEPGKIVLEVDTSSQASVIADRLRRQNFPSFKLQVSGVKENGLDLTLQPK